ncbi:MAG: hypothetical protein IJ091_09315 [Oscillospiraceae bacterium]|nr:hypothetical protein [Oscillospiraceae bacterium]
MTAIKWLFLTALAGHLLCGVCDCLLTYLPKGRFRFEYMKDNQKLSEVFDGMPLRSSVLSMVLGSVAMCMMFFGYMAIYLWMREISPIHANGILLSIGLIFTFGMAHHVLCGVPEWLYVRLGRTEEAREIITELFQKTSVTMIVCYVGFLLFGVTLFAAVVCGLTPLPKWACIFNTAFLMLVLAPFRVGGSGNWAGAIMFLGLLILL